MFENPRIPYLSDDGTIAKGLANSFVKFAESQATVESIEGSSYDDMEVYLVKKAEESLEQYTQQYVSAATIEGKIVPDLTVLTGWFHNEALHTPATTLTLIGNTLLYYFSGKTDYNIEVTNHPLPLTTSDKATASLFTASSAAFVVSYNITFGMAFLVATFVLFLIKERSIKSKHCQFVTGVHTGNFWVSTFVWDFINFLIPSLLILLVLFLFGVEAYSKGTNAGYVNLK